MSLSLDENSAKYQIRAYKPGHIQVNDKIIHRSIIITPDQLIEDWSPQDFSQLTKEHLTMILPLNPVILLLGTGEILQFPPISLYGDLINQKIGVEIMNTHAACRTYNALTAENRKVVAALIIR